MSVKNFRYWEIKPRLNNSLAYTAKYFEIKLTFKVTRSLLCLEHVDFLKTNISVLASFLFDGYILSRD